MARLGTRSLTLTIGGTDYTAEVSKAVITSGESDSDFTTFADAASGGSREYRLEITAAQDLAASSFWTQVFSNTGNTVAFLLKPYGNATPTVTQPHVQGNCILSEPDGDFIGGEADSSASAAMTIETSFVCTERPTLKTAA